MNREFFVMLNSQNGKFVIPLVGGYNDEVILFDSEEDARDAVCDNQFAMAFGYEIFERGAGS